MKNLLNFLNIEVMFMPPKTRYQIQSLDSDIIVALKGNYRSRKISIALDRFEKIQINL